MVEIDIISIWFPFLFLCNRCFNSSISISIDNDVFDDSNSANRVTGIVPNSKFAQTEFSKSSKKIVWYENIQKFQSGTNIVSFETFTSISTDNSNLDVKISAKFAEKIGLSSF